jgi:hypothetical protein
MTFGLLDGLNQQTIGSPTERRTRISPSTRSEPARNGSRLETSCSKPRIEHAERSEELAKRRRELPWVPVEKEYTFDTDEGTKTLAELRGARKDPSSVVRAEHDVVLPPAARPDAEGTPRRVPGLPP